MEYELRKWEIWAPKCVLSDFDAIKVLNKESFILHRIEKAAPLVKDMQYGHLIDVPPEASISSSDDLMICSDSKLYFQEVKRVVRNNNAPTVVELEQDKNNAKQNNDLFQKGDIVAVVRPFIYSTKKHSKKDMWMLMEKEKNKSEKELLRGFKNFQFVASNDDYQFKIQKENCSLERQVSMKEISTAGYRGTWVLTKSNLYMTPWSHLLDDKVKKNP